MNDPVVIGLDVGGSSVKCMVADADSALDRPPVPIVRERRPSPGERPVEDLIALVRDLAGGRPVAAVAVAIPGIVDSRTGTVIRSANLPALSGVALGPALSAAFDVEVAIVNDGPAAAVAEAAWGAGREVDTDDFFMLALGTGIAGAHVVGGEPVSGAHGAAGELGHTKVVDAGSAMPCGCGRSGCLETVIGAPALRRAWQDAGGDGGAKELLDAYDAGDPRAVAIVDRAVAVFAEAVLTLCAITDPGCIIVGGGLASEPHRLVTDAARLVAAEATFHRVPPIVPATLGRWAGAYGTVLTALRLLRPGAAGGSA